MREALLAEPMFNKVTASTNEENMPAETVTAKKLAASAERYR